MTSFPHIIDIIPGSLLFVVAAEMDVHTTHRIAATMRVLDDTQPDGVEDIIPSYGSILVIYDDTVTSASRVVSSLSNAWEQTSELSFEDQRDTVSIAVVYGDTYGDDLANVSDHTGFSTDDVITLHASGTYTVGAVGFAPGFTYLIGMPFALATPRRSSPRLRVPAGSVGIGGAQTGVYALPSAGGWNLIGRSPTRLFDATADPPVLLQLGDSVRFVPIDDADFSGLEPLPVSASGDGPIEVLTPGMQTTLQDLGRYGMGRYGFAIDGAADRLSLVIANALVGNDPGVAGLEITQQGPSLRFDQRLQLALAGADLGARLNGRTVAMERMFETMPGDELSFSPPAHSVGARVYLAVRGGFDVPLVMGSASTNLLAGIGGWHGRALVRGDRLAIGQRLVPDAPFIPGLQRSATMHHRGEPFTVRAGVQRDRFDDATWQKLIAEPFTVSDEANRVGLRLIGASLQPIGGADVLSEGIGTGSIQVTGEGQAIVMLPGRATIGGYTKIATVMPQDWDRLGQLSPGDTIRFREVR